MQLKYYLLLLFYFINNNYGNNPTLQYLAILRDLLSTNPINDQADSKDLILMGHRVIQKNTLQILLDYIMYNNTYKKDPTIKSLLGDLYELHNKEKILNQNQLKALLKNKKVRKSFTLLQNQLYLHENPENILEIFLNNFFFSIYTQKFFIVYIIMAFINEEVPEKIYGLVNFFENNYPSSKHIAFLKLLVLITYYENLSPLLYQHDFMGFMTIFYLIKEIKEQDIKKNYWFILDYIELNTKYIQYEKEIYKAKTLINNGQIGIGINLYKRQLEKYNELVNFPLKDFSIKEFHYLTKSSNLLDPSLYLDKTHESLFYKSFYKKIDYGFLKMNPQIQGTNYHNQFNNLQNNIIIFNIEKDKIIKGKFYKRYKYHQKAYRKFLKQIQKK